MKYNKLIKKMKQLIEKTSHLEKSKIKEIMYGSFEFFKNEYENLNEKTYKRYCRKLLNNISFEYDTDIIGINDISNFEIVKRIAIISDTHCGHYTGLTPPSWQINENNKYFGKFAKIQKLAWDWFVDNVERIKDEREIDVLVTNGDMIDGEGKRSGGTEQITTDRYFQTKMAEEIINLFETDIIRMTYGTPYHTGNGEDYEQILADNVGGKIYNELKIKIGGKIFQFKHKISNSKREQTKATAILNEIITDKIGAINKGIDRADVVVRSHRHKMVIVQDDYSIGMVTPCLQLDSKFGGRQCSGDIDFGFIIIDIYENGKIDIKPITAHLEIKPFEMEEI